MRKILSSSSFRHAAWALAAAAVAGPASAQTYPDKPVRMVVAFAPAGGTDIVARLVAPRMAELFGQSVVVENRAGAGGVIGTENVAKAAPDGYTTLMVTMGNLAVNPYLYSMRVDVQRDLKPVSKVVEVQFALLVHPSVPAKTLREFIDLAKARPGHLTYSSSGIGGGPHLAGELFDSLAGTKLTHVPYKGSGQSLSDLIGGQVSGSFDSLLQALPYVRDGRLRALAILGSERSPLLPDVPTVAEAGVPGYEFTNWYGLVAPAGTPQPVVEKLNGAVRQVLGQPDIRRKLEDMGARVVGDSPEAFGKFIATENTKWEKVIRAAKITAQ